MAVKLGTNVLATTGVQATATITGTTAWTFRSDSVVTTAGSSGVVQSGGTFSYFTAATIPVSWQVTNTVVGTGLSIDLTATQALTLAATWGTSSASNTMTCNSAYVEISY